MQQVDHGNGTVIAGRYALERILGRGGMADVHLATDLVLEREVAVKILREHAASEADRERFGEEARLLAALDHPNVVSILDAGITDEQAYLVLELVDGRSLEPFCDGTPIPAHRVAAIGEQLARVLAYVHTRGVVHRDVKPSNVLIGLDGSVRLADFGIARLLAEPHGHTLTGTTVGTAAYIAPEQVRGEKVSPASDIYSLGLVLLESLTGRRTYPGAPLEAAMARLDRSPLIPTSLPTGWPALLSRMTASEPAQRPAADTVATALHAMADAPAPRHRRSSDQQAERSDDGVVVPFRRTA